MRDLDGQGETESRQQLGVPQFDRIGQMRSTRNGPSGPWLPPDVPGASSTLRAVAKVAHPAPTLEWDTPLYQQASTQLDHALELAGVPDFVSTRLRHPERALILTLPVRMDDGTYRSFPAYRVQHSSVLGPTKGGIRYERVISLRDAALVAAIRDVSRALEARGVYP